jgi:hypothetical protein
MFEPNLNLYNCNYYAVLMQPRQFSISCMPPTQHWNVSLGDKMCSAQLFCLPRKYVTWQWQKSTRSEVTYYNFSHIHSIFCFILILRRCYCMVNQCTFFVLTTILPGTSGQSSWIRSWYTLIGLLDSSFAWFATLDIIPEPTARSAVRGY